MESHAPIKPAARPHCYICGSLEKLTDDHIPPEGFFPPSQGKDLLTAPLCESCHRPLTKMDEKMRVWCSSDGQASAAGKWIWKNAVVGSTFKRSPKLLDHIREKQFRRVVDQAGNLIGGLLTIPQGCPIPFIRRLTKGVLYSFHADYDYFSDFFAVDYQPPKPETAEAVGELVSKMPQVAKGEGVFRVWHGIADTGEAGVCVFLFFDAVCFVCFHGKDAKYQQPFSEGYVEEPGLPKYL